MPRAGVSAGVVCLFLATTAMAQTPEDRVRPIRVGNLNVAVVGAGYAAHDHPTYDDHFFFNLSYQRRILRREVRAVPIWVRFALQFTEDERSDSTYTYWDSRLAGEAVGQETVQEQTSDFGVRAEILVDVLHNKNFALYGGGGIVIHTISFTSRGLLSGNQGAAGLETTENRLAPSVAGGGRFFSAKHPYTFYAEVRYGFTHGRAEGVQDNVPKQVPLRGEFDVKATSNVSFEGGVGVHW